VGTIIEPPLTTLSRNQHSLKGGRRRRDTKQVSIGDMRRGWRESDINKWMEDPVRWRTSMTEEKQPRKILVRKSKNDPLQPRFKAFEEMDKQKV
jgi:hypothetical protein